MTQNKEELDNITLAKIEFEKEFKVGDKFYSGAVKFYHNYETISSITDEGFYYNKGLSQLMDFRGDKKYDSNHNVYFKKWIKYREPSGKRKYLLDRIILIKMILRKVDHNQFREDYEQYHLDKAYRDIKKQFNEIFKTLTTEAEQKARAETAQRIMYSNCTNGSKRQDENMYDVCLKVIEENKQKVII
jgi:hypothetical protein